MALRPIGSSGGGSGVDEAAVRSLISQTLVQGEGVTITPDAEAGTLTIESVAEAAASPMFRGEWTTDSLLDIIDFAGGIPEGMTGSQTGSGALPVLATVVAVGQPDAPAYENAVKLAPGDIRSGNGSTLQVTLGDLGYTGVTRIRVWGAGAQHGSSLNGRRVQLSVVVGGVTAKSWQYVPFGWERAEVACNEADVIQFKGHGYYGANTGTPAAAYVAGIEVYGVADPYMMGQIVMHAGKMWRADSNYVTGEPGTDPQWVEIPLQVADDAESRISALETQVAGFETRIAALEGGA